MQESLFWMNVNLELLAIESHALHRMQKHLSANLEHPLSVEVDLKFLEIEVQRLIKRLVYWEEVVATVRSGRR